MFALLSSRSHPRHARAVAGRAGVAPDLRRSCGADTAGCLRRDGRRRRVGVELLPSRTDRRRAAARRAGVAPDCAVAVQLEQLVRRGRDRLRIRIRVDAAAIPDMRRRCTACRCSARSSVLVQLVERRRGRRDRDRRWISDRAAASRGTRCPRTAGRRSARSRRCCGADRAACRPRRSRRSADCCRSSASRARVAAAGDADEPPDLAVLVPLVDLRSRSGDLRGVGVVVEALPAGAERLVALGADVSPDPRRRCAAGSTDRCAAGRADCPPPSPACRRRQSCRFGRCCRAPAIRCTTSPLHGVPVYRQIRPS